MIANQREGSEVVRQGNLHITLELDNGGFVHAGEILRVKLNVDCLIPNVHLLLATIQLSGELVVDTRHVRLASLLPLARPSLTSANIEYGGGTLVEEVRRFSLSKPIAGKRTKHGVNIIFAPPSVITAGLALQQHVHYSFEWCMAIPTAITPSWEGESCNLQYSVVVGLQFKEDETAVFRQTVNILPSFCQPYIPTEIGNSGAELKRPSSPSSVLPPPAPFQWYPLDQAYVFINDPGSIRCVSPERESPVSIWDRYLAGILPSPKDLKRYPIYTLHERPKPGRGNNAMTQASLFNAYSLDSAPTHFSIPIEQEIVLSAKLNKTHFRLGEMLTCIAAFPPSLTWSVFQMKATLVCTEVLSAAYSTERDPGTSEARTFERIYRSWEGSCWMHQQLSFSLSLPSDANPTLYSNIISFRWHLGIALVCSRKRPPSRDTSAMDGNCFQRQGPILSSTPACEEEKMVVAGTFPLTVVPSLAVLLNVAKAAEEKLLSAPSHPIFSSSSPSPSSSPSLTTLPGKSSTR